ncbi:MAG: SMP-30/gluconolactonase/LRE family protein, partial [Syntrophomonadaceae bacterium]|nr:SMP-30/gluconolactonase/LRE family protein [Syntrophomonadaceae bacterium]
MHNNDQEALDFNSIGKPFFIADGFLFTEGPVWNREENYLLFSDIAGNTIYRWTPPDKINIMRRPSGNSNGLAYDINGDLLAAEHGSRTVTRMLKDGSIHTVASHYTDKKLHSPNDIAVRSDGTIYFTDPPYGLNGRIPELDFMGLYRITPDGRQILEGKYNQYLNGLAFSPDEKIMYLALTEADLLLTLDVADDGS